MNPDLFNQSGWLELTLDYHCNLRCIGCHSAQSQEAELPLERALLRMKQARASGLNQLWIGGGEPTLYQELPIVLRIARVLGFQERLVQTNGIRFIYPHYRRALIDAGLTALRINLKSLDPSIHDELSGSPGAHALLERALHGLQGSPIKIVGDVLLTQRTISSLTATLRHYHQFNISHFSLWLLSAHNSPNSMLLAEIPSPSELNQALLEAASFAESQGIYLESLHTPWCMLENELHDLFKPASSWDLTIVDPSDRPFTLESSPIEGGVYLPECDGCVKRSICPGLRADFLKRHGSKWLRPIR